MGAAASAKARAAEEAADREAKVLADSVVAGLLPAAAPNVQESMVEGNFGGEDSSSALAANLDGGKGDDDGTEIDVLFSRKRKRGQRQHVSTQDEENSEGDSTGEPKEQAKAVQGGGDLTLQETLELIASKAPSRVRRKQKKRAALAAATTNAD